MKNICKVIFMCMLFLTSCGGSSGGYDSEISGTWTGDLYRGVIICSDSLSTGACGGCITGRAELQISGSDEIGSLVQIKEGDCQLEASRTQEGIKARPIAGCDKDLVYLDFNLLDDGSAGVTYLYDGAKSQTDANAVTCKVAPSGTVNR